MSAALLVLTFALLNCFRGRGWVPGDRVIACAGMGLAAGVYSGFMPTGVVVAAGVFLWSIPGWSFDEISGQFDRKKYHGWIRWIGLKAYPDAGFRQDNLRRGVLMKSLRGLYLYPLFTALAWAVTPWSLLIGLGCLMQGPCYGLMRHAPKQHAVAIAELLWGAVMGAMVTLALGVGNVG